jgi:hypothetical protein
MKTITELRNYVDTNIKLLGYEHDQIFKMIDLFEQGLIKECKLNNLKEDKKTILKILK